MRTTLNIEDALIKKASQLTGVRVAEENKSPKMRWILVHLQDAN